MSTDGLRFRFSCADMSGADFVSTATALRRAAIIYFYTTTHTRTHKQAHTAVSCCCQWAVEQTITDASLHAKQTARLAR